MVPLRTTHDRNQKWSHLSCCNSSIVSAVGNQYMSAVDWRSEQDYANFEKAETADIAWEWLRRDGEYHRDYGALAIRRAIEWRDSRFPAQMGVVFSQLIPKRRSIDNRFSGRRRLCRSVLSLRQIAPSRDIGHYDLDLTMLPGGEFRRAPDGWHAIVPLGGAIHRLYLPRLLSGGAPLAVELRLDANFDIRSAGSTQILVGAGTAAS